MDGTYARALFCSHSVTGAWCSIPERDRLVNQFPRHWNRTSEWHKEKKERKREEKGENEWMDEWKWIKGISGFLFIWLWL